MRYAFFLTTIFLTVPCRADLPADALAAAKTATAFYWKQVSTEGGYLWRYSSDLQLREGEGKAKSTTVWVQPPGTPAMGHAFVRLFEATGDPLFHDAARAAAEALRRGQLRSGGWNAGIDFDPADHRRDAYRVDPAGKNQRNHSSLDDDKTQSSLRFLIQLDRVQKFRDEAVHGMTMYALDHLLQAQYPNGGFPQVWAEPYDPAEHPVRAARFPATWSRTYPGHQNYWFRYTLNDNLLPDLIPVLFLAGDVYGDKRFRHSAVKAADFLLLAQLPEPQPAWAQQYDFDMQPAWARKFEPPAITGGESQGAMRALMQVYRRTGDHKYLEPIPRAVAYLRKSLLPDGRLARFYELQTNKPLYMTREYALTFDDTDLPTHYGFKVGSQLEQIEREYKKLLNASPDQLDAVTEKQGTSPDLEQRVRRTIDALDERGAWITKGDLRYQKYSGPLIDMAVAIGNLNLLADYLATSASGR